MTGEPTILFTHAEGIGRITLNRAAKLNALDPEMMARLDAVLAEIEESQDVRVVIVEAAGEKAFCAGADINAWSALAPIDMWRTWVRRGHRLFDRLADLRQPTIAAMKGIAFGGGLELGLACDMRFAADTARFGMPEVTIATAPGWAGTGRLPRLIGVARAKQMILTGTPVDAATAAVWGLINASLPMSELDAAVTEVAQAVARNAPVSVQIAKQIIDAAASGSPTAALEAMAGAVCAATEDGKEGFSAFRERRAPRYKGY